MPPRDSPGPGATRACQMACHRRPHPQTPQAPAGWRSQARPVNSSTKAARARGGRRVAVPPRTTQGQGQPEHAKWHATATPQTTPQAPVGWRSQAKPANPNTRATRARSGRRVAMPPENNPGPGASGACQNGMLTETTPDTPGADGVAEPGHACKLRHPGGTGGTHGGGPTGQPNQILATAQTEEPCKQIATTRPRHCFQASVVGTSIVGASVVGTSAVGASAVGALGRS